jgi:hypothetical protein
MATVRSSRVATNKLRRPRPSFTVDMQSQSDKFLRSRSLVYTNIDADMDQLVLLVARTRIFL